MIRTCMSLGRRLLWPVILLAVGAAVLPVAGAQTRPASAPAAEEWNRVLDAYTQARARISSIELTYTTVSDYDPPTPITLNGRNERCKRQIDRVSLAHAGDKFNHQVAVDWLDAGGEKLGGKTDHVTSAFDGQRGARRMDLFKGMLLVSRDPGSVRIAVTPLEYAARRGPQWIDSNIREGKFRVESIRPDALDGRETLAVKGRSDTNYSFTIWLSPRQSWLVVRTESHDPQGQLSYVNVVTDIATIRLQDGTETHYPLAGTTRSLHRGREGVRSTFSVDRESIKINCPIDESRFELLPQRGELIRDTDLQENLPNPMNTGPG